MECLVCYQKNICYKCKMCTMVICKECYLELNKTTCPQCRTDNYNDKLNEFKKLNDYTISNPISFWNYQYVARGACDFYLHSNPKITYFGAAHKEEKNINYGKNIKKKQTHNKVYYDKKRYVDRYKFKNMRR